MDALHWLPFVSTTITVLFAAAVFSHNFQRNQRPHLLMWGIGLALYALGAFA